MENIRESERSEGKIKRVPMGGMRLKLQLSEADVKGFKVRQKVARWFNDDPGRVERARAGGYDFVDPKYATSLGEGALHRGNSSKAQRVSVVVNRSDPITRAYLMEIDEAFYKEDQEAKEAVNRQVDDALALGGKGASDLENVYKPNS